MNKPARLAIIAAIALTAGSLLVGFTLRPDNAEAVIAPKPVRPMKGIVLQPGTSEVVDLGDIDELPRVITVKETVIVSKRRPSPSMRVGTTVVDPRPVPEMKCTGWIDSLAGGQYRRCDNVQQ